MGSTARTAVGETFGLAAVVDRWERTYRDLLGGRMGTIAGRDHPGGS
jgi:hypothetical protein